MDIERDAAEYQELINKFEKAPSELKIGRVLLFFYQELGFSNPHTNINWRLSYKWPTTKEGWKVAEAAYEKELVKDPEYDTSRSRIDINATPSVTGINSKTDLKVNSESKEETLNK